MERLKQLRHKINEVDEQILQSLKKRVEISKSIGLVKKKKGIAIQDVPRENDVFTHVRKKALDLGLNPAYVEAIYWQIVHLCSEVQN